MVTSAVLLADLQSPGKSSHLHGFFAPTVHSCIPPCDVFPPTRLDLPDVLEHELSRSISRFCQECCYGLSTRLLDVFLYPCAFIHYRDLFATPEHLQRAPTPCFPQTCITQTGSDSPSRCEHVVYMTQYICLLIHPALDAFTEPNRRGAESKLLCCVRLFIEVPFCAACGREASSWIRAQTLPTWLRMSGRQVSSFFFFFFFFFLAPACE